MVGVWVAPHTLTQALSCALPQPRTAARPRGPSLTNLTETPRTHSQDLTNKGFPLHARSICRRSPRRKRVWVDCFSSSPPFLRSTIMRSRISRGSEHPFLGDDGQRYRHLPRRCVSLLFLIQHGELLPQVNQESLGVRSQPRRPPE